MSTSSDHLFAIVAKHAPDVPPEVLDAVVRLIEDYDINDSITFEAEIGNRLGSSILEEICDAWRAAPDIRGRDIGTAFRTAALVGRQDSDEFTQLVATRPWDSKSSTRDSLAAYLNVSKKAQNRLTMAMFVVYEVADILKALEDAQKRAVAIRILVEPPANEGGNVLGRHNSVQVVRKHLPNAEIYIPNSQQINGTMHAKFVSADERYAFVTSANLTKAALSRNIEVGVLLSGGKIPKRIDSMFDELITRNSITLVP
mgnify:FL=1